MYKLYLLFSLHFMLSITRLAAQYTPLQWQQSYENGSAQRIIDFPIYFFGSNKMVKLSNGGAVLAGNYNNDIGLWKVDAVGNVLWRKTFGGSLNDHLYAIRQCADGGFVLAGRTLSSDGIFDEIHSSFDAFLIKTDADGNVLWTRTVGGQMDDAYTCIEFLGSDIIAIGHTDSNDGDITMNHGAGDILISRFAQDGTPVWTQTFGTANCERALTSLVTKNGQIIVGGTFANQTYCDFGSPIKKLLISVDGNGILQWQNSAIIGAGFETGSITNLAFNADSSEICSLVKDHIFLQPKFYRFSSVTGEVIAIKQLTINITADFGPTVMRRLSSGQYLVGLASPQYRLDPFDPRNTYLATLSGNGDLLSLDHFNFNQGIITDIIERDNDYLFYSTQSDPYFPLALYVGAYAPSGAKGTAEVVPSGSNPVSGTVNQAVTTDPSVQTYQGQAYVQRHYDITPANNAATATATITLYFTQSDFDNYNAHPAHGLDLPHGPTDDFNKANLRVYQYHGFSTTSLPGSYSGNGVEIDPDDTRIVWNTLTLQWEVTFEVNGFSGFFVAAANSSMLPVTILSFTGQARDQQVHLHWRTSDQLNVARFELQRRDVNSEFATIGQVKARYNNNLVVDYDYVDMPGVSPVYQYRLKIVDEDQSITYSKFVTVRWSTAGNLTLSLKPNPATDFVVVQHPVSDGRSTIRVVDMQGKIIRSSVVGANAIQTRLALTGIPQGTYTLVWEDGKERLSQVVIVR